ncbi:MAG: hypothetical protein E7020_02655 [Alphaproteobacteria bacterium]|nr:hypothetical protein [Alphaproteobacteria bacterium]
MTIIVNDKMQTNYSYELVEPIGKNFAFDFTPELSPKQMLAMGVFEGHYLNDCQNEFPYDWFENAKISLSKPDISCNMFGLKSRQPLSVWQKKGWIIMPDPRGWFQWYCRYYMGRRIIDIDKIQIKRWRSFRRHKAQIEQNCSMFDIDCRKRQRQALLQWAYNPIF